MRENGNLSKLWEMDGFVSPRMGIKFETAEGELVIYRPDGQRFLSSIELEQRFQQERTRAQRAELLLEEERQRSEQMAAYLRSIGVDPDNIGNL